VEFKQDTPVQMPAALTPGSDLAFYACADGSVRASTRFDGLPELPAGQWRLIGGGHISLTAADSTIHSGGFNGFYGRKPMWTPLPGSISGACGTCSTGR
jgi:hypothetical protein